jgi:hypothetical protein
MGRPTEMSDCLQNAKKETLRAYERVQRLRTKEKEQSYMAFQRAGAPAHMLVRVEAGIYRENLALRLIKDSIYML